MENVPVQVKSCLKALPCRRSKTDEGEQSKQKRTRLPKRQREKARRKAEGLTGQPRLKKTSVKNTPPLKPAWWTPKGDSVEYGAYHHVNFGSTPKVEVIEMYIDDPDQILGIPRGPSDLNKDDLPRDLNYPWRQAVVDQTHRDTPFRIDPENHDVLFFQSVPESSFRAYAAALRKARVLVQHVKADYKKSTKRCDYEVPGKPIVWEKESVKQYNEHKDIFGDGHEYYDIFRSTYQGGSTFECAEIFYDADNFEKQKKKYRESLVLGLAPEKQHYIHLGKHVPPEFKDPDKQIPSRGPRPGEEAWEAIFPEPPLKPIAAAPAVAGDTAEDWESLDPRDVAYVLIEYCCSQNSSLCSEKHATHDGKPVARIRLTEKHDLTKQGGLDYAIRALHHFASCGPRIFLWASVPCTAGCAWQHVNKGQCANHDANQAYHFRVFHKLYRNFIKLADEVKAMKGKIAWEWPDNNSMWKFPKINQLIRRYNLEPVRFHGCAVGCVSKEGRPHKKPWKFVTNIECLRERFKNKKCNHKPGEHEQVRGSHTKKTGYYPDKMTAEVHKAMQDTIAKLMLENSDPPWPPKGDDKLDSANVTPRKPPETSISTPEKGERLIEPRAAPPHFGPAVDLKFSELTKAGELSLAANKAYGPELPQPKGRRNCDIRGNRAALAALLPSVAVAGLFSLDNEWIFDSGCGHDLVGLANARYLKKHFQKVNKARFDTANGKTESTLTVPINLPLDDVLGRGHESLMANPFVLEDTPGVLSMGLRCMHQGYAFIWLPGKLPCLITREGYLFPLDLDGDIPLFKEDGCWRRVNDVDFCRQECGIELTDGNIVVHLDKRFAQTRTNHYRAVPGKSKKFCGDFRQDSHDPFIDDPLPEKEEEPSEPDSDGSTATGPAGTVGELTTANNTDDSDLECVSDTDPTEIEVRHSLIKESMSLEHFLNHKRSLPDHCEMCMRAKTKRKPRKRGSFSRETTAFGEIGTIDHVVMKDWMGLPGVGGFYDALNYLDLFSGYKASVPVKKKDTFETFTALNNIKGKDIFASIYSDNWEALKKAVRGIRATWEGSLPGVHKSNAIIERCNQDILYGARVCLGQAGLPGCFWTYAAPYYCHIENILEDPDGNSAWKARHGSGFTGRAIPFGCGVFFLPSPTHYTNHKTLPAMSYGIFLGYRLAPGGRWNGEYIVQDLDTFIDMPLDAEASSTECYVHPHITEQVRLGARGICFPLKPAYDRANLTLDGRQSSSNHWKYDSFGVPETCQFSEADASAAAEPGSEASPAVGGDGEASPVGLGTPEPVTPAPASPEVVREKTRHPAATDNIFVDAIGRVFPADEFGNKIMLTARPLDIPSAAWNAMSKDRQNVELKARKTRLQEENQAKADQKKKEDFRKKKKQKIEEEAQVDFVVAATGGEPTSSKPPGSPATVAREAKDAPIGPTLIFEDPLVPNNDDGDWGEADFEQSVKDFDNNWDEMCTAYQKADTGHSWAACLARMNNKEADPRKEGGVQNDVSQDSKPEFPRMKRAPPQKARKHRHRRKIDTAVQYFNAAIARPVSKKEIFENEKCVKAMHVEWDKLNNKGVWDLKSVSEWKDVARKANAAGETIHMGRVFGIMVEKNYETPEYSKYKYRVVFQGNNVFTQNHEAAVFQNQGSAPASMETGKSTDFYGCLRGHELEQADAMQAYVQADLEGTVTWVTLPKEAWPPYWVDTKDHPDLDPLMARLFPVTLFQQAVTRKVLVPRRILIRFS